MRRHAITLSVFLASAGIGETALAQTSYPSKPLRFIVAYGPGSTLDIMARTIGPHLSQAFAQPVIVENRPGAGGMIGTDAAAKAAPDGHTMTMSALGPLVTNPVLYPKSPFDPVRDFAGVAMIATGPVVIVTHPSVPARTLKDLVALAKAWPGQLNYGTPGVGSSPHLAGELLRIVTATDLVHVPYKGNAEALTDLVGGQISIVFSGVPPVVPLAQGGRVKVLATTGRQRLAGFPDVETVAEAGWAGAQVLIWYGVAVPSATPRDIVNRLHAQIVRIMGLADVRSRFVQLGVEPVSSSADEFTALIRSEHVRWTKIIRTANIRID